MIAALASLPPSSASARDPLDVLREKEALITVSWDRLQECGVTYEFTEVTEFVPEHPGVPYEKHVVEGTEVFWRGMYRQEFAQHGRTFDQGNRRPFSGRTVIAFDGQCLRSFYVTESGELGLAEGVVGSPYAYVDPRSESRGRRHRATMDPARAARLCTPEDWVEEPLLGGYPARVAQSRREVGRLPPVSHALGEEGPQTIVTSAFRDSHLWARVDGEERTFEVEKLLRFDEALGALPVRCEIRKWGKPRRIWELTWTPVRWANEELWLLTEAVTTWPGPPEPHVAFRETFRINPQSIRLGPPDQSQFVADFPPGARVYDYGSGQGYTVAAQPNGRDILDRQVGAMARKLAEAGGPTTRPSRGDRAPAGTARGACTAGAEWRTPMPALVGVPLILAFTWLVQRRRRITNGGAARPV